MTQLNTHDSVGTLVVNRPARAIVFERFGIDYCCGGKRPLDEVCAERGLDLDKIRQALENCDQANQSPEETDWAKESLADLADHIIRNHHDYLREELPRLATLLEKVAAVHGARHPEMPVCRDIFWSFKAGLEAHMQKEETILFPLVRVLESGKHVTPFHCGSIANPIRVMESEHDHAGDALTRMRELTNGFRAPPDGCTTFGVLMHGLKRLEADMHQHVHKENNILFPRALELERKITSSAGCA